jgi:hypothetical protein
MGGYGWRQRGARFPWFGLLLVALGVALAVDQAELGIAWAHSLALLVGLAAWVAFLVGWGGWAGLGAVVLTGWGAARVAQDVGLVSGSGWAPLLIGAGFLALYLVGLARQAGRYGWAVWVGLILVVVGGAQVAAREIPGVPPLDELVVPLILVGLGAFLIVRGMRRNAHGGA